MKFLVRVRAAKGGSACGSAHISCSAADSPKRNSAIA
jgi:hypothetical protein